MMSPKYFILFFNSKLVRYCIINKHIWYNLNDISKILQLSKYDLDTFKLKLRYDQMIRKLCECSSTYIKTENLKQLAHVCSLIGIEQYPLFVFLLNKDTDLKRRLYNDIAHNLTNGNIEHFNGLLDSYSIARDTDFQLLGSAQQTVDMLYTIPSTNNNILQIVQCISKYIQTLCKDQNASNDRLDFWFIWYELTNDNEYNGNLYKEMCLIERRNKYIDLLLQRKLKLSTIIMSL